MQTVEPFDCTVEPGAVVIHSVPGLHHYNPIGSVHGGYAAILLDSAMGLSVQSTLPAGTGYTTLEFKISLVRGMSETSGVIRTEARVLNAGRRVATAEARITDAKDRLLAHATTTCLVFEFPKGSASTSSSTALLSEAFTRKPAIIPSRCKRFPKLAELHRFLGCAPALNTRMT